MNGPMVGYMKAIGTIAEFTEKVNSTGQMVETIKESTSTSSCMATVD